jgi:hypothetical protein
MTTGQASSILARTTLVAGFAAIVALAIGLASVPRSVVQGWLIAFVFVGGIPIGSLVLLLIHRLTGGRWGDVLSPVLTGAASRMPFVAIAFVPLAFGLSAPYRWAVDPTGIRQAVAQVYLNEPAFLLRTAVALFGWSALAFLVVKGRCTELAAGLGLVFYGIFISLVAVDWILSIDSSFSSSAFAAGIAIEQLLSALSFAALVGPGARNGTAGADLGGLIIATLLGTVYLDLMSFIVIWYGNLPDKAAWYLTRGRNGWEWLIVAAAFLGALLPFLILLKSSFRQSPIALRIVGTLTLTGVFLHVIWLIGPAFGRAAVIAAVVALIAMASLGTVNRSALRLRSSGNE